MFALHMVHGMFPDMFKDDVSTAVGDSTSTCEFWLADRAVVHSKSVYMHCLRYLNILLLFLQCLCCIVL